MDFNDVRLRYESLRDEIDRAIGSVLSGGRYILGPLVETFEDEFARYCGAARGIGVGSGTDALKIGLRAIGVRAGEAVRVPAVTAAAFSFYPTKNLATYGDGGMLVTSDAAITEASRLLRNYGQRENYSSKILGENSRLDELHAAILRVSLRRLDEWNGRRRAIAEKYREAFRELPIGLQAQTGKSNAHLFVVTTAHRDRLRSYLDECGVPTLTHYPVALHRQKAFAEFRPA